MVENKNDTAGEIKVSVIVPVYNVEDYLEECVDSLVGQTLKEIEILLIDDGSTDSSGAMCDSYAQKYGNVSVIHKTNGGLGDARNVGFSAAKGKYVYFIDSDDFLELGALQFLYEEAENKQLDIILFSAESFSDEEEIRFNPDEYKRTKFLNEVKSGKEMFINLYSAREYYASIPLRFYNREFFEKNGYKFPDIIHEDEFPGFLSLIEAERAECVEYKFYKRRFRKGSIMTSEKAYKSAIGYVYTWNELMGICQKFELKKQNEYIKFIMSFLSLIRNLYVSSFDKNDRKRFKKVRYEICKVLGTDIKKIDRSTRWFLKSPILYMIYKNYVKFGGK